MWACSSLCSLIPLCHSRSWAFDMCCYCIHLASFVLELPILRIVGTITGTIVGLILLINARSLPLVWHINVLLPFGIVRCKYRILSLYHAFSLQPKATRHRTVVNQLEACCPVGADPFEFSATVRSWASPDETDWFGHVNNSNYAKARDAALSKFGLAAWPTFVNAGGWVVLGSTHYHFLREIPRFAWYEMHLSIGAWDHKWLYLVCRFTSRSAEHSTRGQAALAKSGDPTGRAAPAMTSAAGSMRFSSDDERAHKRLIPGSTATAGATLHCFTVSRLCFKIGRITVPPALVMASEGFSTPPKVGSYSHQLPPPHWSHPSALRHASGSLDAYRRFLAGGWRDVPQGDRWWIEPLSGPTDERRRVNLARLEVIDRAVVDCMDILS